MKNIKNKIFEIINEYKSGKIDKYYTTKTLLVLNIFSNLFSTIFSLSDFIALFF